MGRERTGRRTWWVLVAGEGPDEDLGTWSKAAAAAAAAVAAVAGGPVDACERGVNEVEGNCTGLFVDMGCSFSSNSFFLFFFKQKVCITYILLDLLFNSFRGTLHMIRWNIGFKLVIGTLQMSKHSIFILLWCNFFL